MHEGYRNYLWDHSVKHSIDCLNEPCIQTPTQTTIAVKHVWKNFGVAWNPEAWTKFTFVIATLWLQIPVNQFNMQPSSNGTLLVTSWLQQGPYQQMQICFAVLMTNHLWTIKEWLYPTKELGFIIQISSISCCTWELVLKGRIKSRRVHLWSFVPWLEWCVSGGSWGVGGVLGERKEDWARLAHLFEVQLCRFWSILMSPWKAEELNTRVKLARLQARRTKDVSKARKDRFRSIDIKSNFSTSDQQFWILKYVEPLAATEGK